MRKNQLIELSRFVIIMWVVLYHYTHRYFDLFPTGEHINFFSTGGTIGVPLFFLISGFFSGKILLHKKIGLKESLKYFINKYWRLWPAYMVSILIIFSAIKIFGLQGYVVTFKQLIANILIYHPGFSNVDGAHWFIIDLVKIYAFLSILTLFSPRSKTIITAFSFVLFLTIYITGKYADIHVINSISSFWPCRSCTCFISGMLLFKCISENEDKYLIFLPLLLFGFESFYYKTLLYLCCVIGISIILVKQYYVKLPKFCGYLGGLSYYIYLIHQNIGYIIINNSEVYFVGLLTAILVTLILAVIIERLLHSVPSKLLK